eukprot:13502939-Ditylum_brightwellii.AAC.1
MKELGMTRDRFLFMWCNFHVYNEEDIDMQAEEEAEKAYDSDDDGILEFVIEHDQKDQEVEDPSDEEGEEKEETCGERKEGSPSEKKVLGTFLTLGEMMMQFCGCSVEMLQMKRKPIGEGY